MSMTHLPRVLIVGRPNVGKSTFMNRILRRQHAITMDEPGITRDLVSSIAEWQDIPFELLDSGGVLFEGPDADTQGFQPQIEKKVTQAIASCSKIIFIVDGKNGLHPNDRVIAKRLMPYKSKVIVGVNKLDDLERNTHIHEFYKLGLGDPLSISSLHGHGILALMDRVVEGFFKSEVPELDPSEPMKIAIIGRPNVGKSSFINALLQEDRLIVSDIAGTTRDAVDVRLQYQDQSLLLVDTAGMRKRKKVDDGVEFYSVRRSLKSVFESDCVIVMLDAEAGLTHQDIKIIDFVLEKGKGLILVANKWDKVPEASKAVQDQFVEFLFQTMPKLRFYPVLFTSVPQNKGLYQVMARAVKIVTASRVRVSTGKLNQFVTQVLKRNPPPAKHGKRVKIYYATQVEVAPPRYVFFVNHKTSVSADYERFLESRIREYLGDLEGVILHIHFRSEHGHETDLS